mmetsp:Transcript_10427/g.27086  ORF Transcript_10427/g.27086 Transcript_10427/m.27086 type:complete len:200 (-) Transcript_10427:47-646(-)
MHSVAVSGARCQEVDSQGANCEATCHLHRWQRASLHKLAETAGHEVQLIRLGLVDALPRNLDPFQQWRQGLEEDSRLFARDDVPHPETCGCAICALLAHAKASEDELLLLGEIVDMPHSDRVSRAEVLHLAPRLGLICSGLHVAAQLVKQPAPALGGCLLGDPSLALATLKRAPYEARYPVNGAVHHTAQLGRVRLGRR